MDSMDEEAKEIFDLFQNRMSSILIRQRQREDTALEHENQKLTAEKEQLQTENTQLRRENSLIKSDNNSLKNENQHLRQRLASSTQRCCQANSRLAEAKQSNQELEADNKRLKEELEQQIQSALVQTQQIPIEETTNQAQTIKTLEEQIRQSNGENQSLQNRLESMEHHEIEFKTTVSKLKMKLSLALEDLSGIDDNLSDNSLLEVIRYINKDGNDSVIELD